MIQYIVKFSMKIKQNWIRKRKRNWKKERTSFSMIWSRSRISRSNRSTFWFKSSSFLLVSSYNLFVVESLVELIPLRDEEFDIETVLCIVGSGFVFVDEWFSNREIKPREPILGCVVVVVVFDCWSSDPSFDFSSSRISTSFVS